MSQQLIQFDVFNPMHLSHWIVALVQLLRREKYWWVVHVALPVGNTELYVRYNTMNLVSKRSHDRELYWYPLSKNENTLLLLSIQSDYWLNCAKVVSYATESPIIYHTPASLFFAAIKYTAHVCNPDNSTVN